jgi:hypothetical protein
LIHRDDGLLFELDLRTLSPCCSTAAAGEKIVPWQLRLDPAEVFDLTLPMEQVAEEYRAMDQRLAVKTLLRP